MAKHKGAKGARSYSVKHGKGNPMQSGPRVRSTGQPNPAMGGRRTGQSKSK